MTDPDPRVAAYTASYDSLALHLVSDHAHTPHTLTELSDQELRDDHEHEHRGPGTIRNHDPQSLHWDADKIYDAIRHHDPHQSDLPEQVAALEYRLGLTEEPPGQVTRTVIDQADTGQPFLPPGMYTGTTGTAVLVTGDQRLLVVGEYPPTIAGIRVTEPQHLADLADAIRALAEKRGQATGAKIRPGDPDAADVLRDARVRIAGLGTSGLHGQILRSEALDALNQAAARHGVTL